MSVALPLHLVATEHTVRPPLAWLLPRRRPQGAAMPPDAAAAAQAAAAAWLTEIARWRIPAARMILLPLPRASHDPRGGDLLVALPSGDRPAVAPCGVAYGLVGTRLYLPVRAQLHPAVTDAELDALPGSEILVLHPTLGLVGFDGAEQLRLTDLVAPPTAAGNDWTGAVAGPPPLPRLTSATPALQLGFEELFARERRDIGGDASGSRGEPRANRDARTAEAAAGDGRDTRSGMRRWLEMQGSRAVDWAASALTGSKGERDAAEAGDAPAGDPASEGADEEAAKPRRRGWLSRLADRARRRHESLSHDLERERYREINRLMQLLEEDPDRGLRYALPVHGQGGAGGGEPVGSRLLERNPAFDMLRFFGSSKLASEAWSVSHERHRQLKMRYRELAEREVTLGRPRRAAYILAELLGDADGAAAVLRRGGCYREAAAIYRERLQKPVVAAECLAEGGFLEEAAGLYVQLGKPEDAAGLYERVEQHDEARRYWLMAVDQRRSRGDRIGAADILELIDEPDEALGVLASGWPDSHQARRCQVNRFAVLGRLGRHEAAYQLARELEVTPVAPGGGVRQPIVVDVLAEVASSYPDGRVRQRSADAAKVAGAHLLARGSRAQHTLTLRALASLEPDDPLWRQDCRRYGDELRREVAPQPTRPSVASLRENRPRLLRNIQLPRDALWHSAALLRTGFVAGGISELGIVIVRGDWSGRLQRLEWRSPPPDAELALLPTTEERLGTLAVLSNGQKITPRELPVSDHFPRPLRIGTPEWLPADVLALAPSLGGLLWVLRGDAEEQILGTYDRHGAVISLGSLPPPLSAGAGLPELRAGLQPLLARRRGAALCLGSRLLRLGREGTREHAEWDSCNLPATPHALAGWSPPAGSTTPSGLLAAACPHGVLVVDEVPSLPLLAHVAEDAPEPRCAFLPDGRLYIAGDTGSSVWKLENGRLRQHAAFDRAAAPIAVLLTGNRDELAVFTRDGTVSVIRAR